MKYFNESIKSALKDLNVNLEEGLRDSVIEERNEKYGKMNLRERKKKAYLMT